MATLAQLAQQYLNQVHQLNVQILKKELKSDYVTLYRGIRGDRAEQIIRDAIKSPKSGVLVQFDPLTSFTESRTSASNFGVARGSMPQFVGIVFKKKLPVDRSISSFRLVGEGIEKEHIIFGDKINFKHWFNFCYFFTLLK